MGQFDNFFYATSKFLFTTERSEVDPFFMAVRAEKRGREATSHPWGVASPTRHSPHSLGCEATTILLGNLPPFASFSHESCS